MEFAELYEQSDFFEKYKGTYFSDCIVKDILGEKIRKRPLRNFSKLSYEEIYALNLKVMTDLLEFSNIEKFSLNKEDTWMLLKSIYLDPDGASVKHYYGVECTADGLLSIRRIFSYYGLSSEMIEEYEKYRKIPVIHFPEEKNGINMSRATAFGDRLDVTLFDIKNYMSGKACRLLDAYTLPKTKEWLEKAGSFEHLIDELGIAGIFTNQKYEVYNLERDTDNVIEEYEETYVWKWSENYYRNIKKKLDDYFESLC